MMLWFAVNSALTLLVLVFLKASDDTPYRLRFYCRMGALGAWLVPWHYLHALVPPTLMEPMVLQLGPVQQPLLTAVAATETLTSGTAGITFRQWLLPLLLSVLVLGSCLFLRTLRDHARLLERLSASAQAHRDCRVPQELKDKLRQQFRYLPDIAFQDYIPGALTTGVRHPVIWLHARLAHHPSLPSVLQHELVHVRQHDNAWLWLITLCEKLFWWNPLVRALAARARRDQELSCDARCQTLDSGYRLALSRLVLDLATSSNAESRELQPLCSGIVQDANFNVDRVRQLQRSLTMKMKHLAGTGLLVFGALLAVGSPLVLSQADEEAEARARAASAQASAEQEATRERSRADVEAKLAAIEASRGEAESEREMRERQIVAGLEVYADRLEAAYTELQQNKAELESRVRELEERLASQD